jgi:hypothetical protein
MAAARAARRGRPAVGLGVRRAVDLARIGTDANPNAWRSVCRRPRPVRAWRSGIGSSRYDCSASVGKVTSHRHAAGPLVRVPLDTRAGELAWQPARRPLRRIGGRVRADGESFGEWMLA